MSENNAFKITYGNTSATFNEGEPDILLNTDGKHLDSNIQITQGNATDYGIYFGDNVDDEITGRADATGDITLNTQGAVSDKKIIVKPRFQSAVDTPYLHFSSPNQFGIGENTTVNQRIYPTGVTVQYSYDGVSWTSFTYATSDNYRVWTSRAKARPSTQDNLYHLYLRGVGGSNTSGFSYGLPFYGTNLRTITVTGRLNSLINYQNENCIGKYGYLFANYGTYYQGSLGTEKTGLICDASQLLMPSSVSTTNCCEYMFSGCSSLTAAPRLSTMTLGDYCYMRMFESCTSLVTAPALPATELCQFCYSNMFRGCTNLTTLPRLSAIELKKNCYYQMFYNCKLIYLSDTQTGDYQTPYRIPTNGNGVTATNALNQMFTSTGGSFKSTPTINTTYYTANQVI